MTNNQQSKFITAADYSAWAQPEPDHKIAYGAHPQQFGHLFLPEGEGPHPVVVFIHGGCYLTQYDIHPCNALCQTLAKSGLAVWSIEYRRRDTGGEWPHLFQDVSAGADFLRELAPKYNLDLNRVVAAGHSAGGHLAMWLAGRHKLTLESELYQADPLTFRSVVALAPLADTSATAEGSLCDNALLDVIGGLPAVLPERYAQVSPLALLPLEVPQTLIVGAADGASLIEQNRRYAQQAAGASDPVELVIVADAGHFEIVATHTHAWGIVQAHLLKAASK